jgi:hypothetical protein
MLHLHREHAGAEDGSSATEEELGRYAALVREVGAAVSMQAAAAVERLKEVQHRLHKEGAEPDPHMGDATG